MRSLSIVSITLIILCLGLGLLSFFTKTERTITYFPIDPSKNFIQAETRFSFDEANQELSWKAHSKSSEPAYLRQDLSLLFVNGRLKGILNRWREQERTIELEESFPLTSPSLLQAISFHHGEWQDKERITSNQQMTNATAYLLEGNFVEKLTNKKDKDLAKELITIIDSELNLYWEDLIQHYGLNEIDYLFFSLAELDHLAQYLTRKLSPEASAKIIGQLWEGLYKNYLLLAVEEHSNDYMPLVLLAKDLSHLYVLFQIKGVDYQLRQQITLENIHILH